ncbi:hypothetical protein G7Y89_g3485 [Cudoniella acicularis]|uniref:Acyltransferase MbtK/IucB-like conserved domain-containing protein n=1 Tax=Cudoniella acicularis TaxID=354080 RepID=A0A8H4W5J9_9HELO|nr:hypothetical protein G7Y89_g3485 [Cudoniella acicularis]
MAPTASVVHLPNGQNLTVTPVFGGFFFKSNELNLHSSVFPAGWTIILQSEDSYEDHDTETSSKAELSGMPPKEKHRHIHPFRQPTLQNDNLFISSISNPSSSEFKAPTSPTRQIAMMLWASLYWYFHQPEPSPYLTTEASKNTPDSGKPRGEWRINIKREGVLRGRNLIQKLERMGLITSDDSAVGINPEENTAEGWSEMYTSRRTFWQLSAKLFLFTLTPTIGSSFPGSPYGSRPSSPVRGEHRTNSPKQAEFSEHPSVANAGMWSPSTLGPFASGSHLPTYFPPPPLQYTMTSGVRHPVRPKPPRQGEIFYTRFIPSVGQYIAFRAASLSPKPVAYNGPTASLIPPKHQYNASSLSSLPAHISVASIADLTPPSLAAETEDVTMMNDLQLLNKWMNIPRVSHFWGCSGPQSTQEAFLKSNLTSKHSFPAIGLWDGKPFGYFEIYWVKEDILGKHLGDAAGDYDRGFHVLVGEDEFRGKHRVKSWATSIAQWAFVQDYRTNAVVLEPRIDNERFISHLGEAGFLKEREITFPHKQMLKQKSIRINQHILQHTPTPRLIPTPHYSPGKIIIKESIRLPNPPSTSPPLMTIFPTLPISITTATAPPSTSTSNTSPTQASASQTALGKLSTDQDVILISTFALVFLFLVILGILFLTRKKRRQRILDAQKAQGETRGLLQRGSGSIGYVSGAEAERGRSLDERGIRWPEKVVLKEEAREFWRLGREWELERGKQMECKRGYAE